MRAALWLGEQWEGSVARLPAVAVADIVGACALTPVTSAVALPGGVVAQLLAESHVIAWPELGGAGVSLFSCRRLAPGMLPSGFQCAPRGPVGVEGVVEGARRLYAAADVCTDAIFAELGLASATELSHDFTPHGRSAARAHDRGWAVVHTWPEHALVAVDCGGVVLERSLRTGGLRLVAEAG